MKIELFDHGYVELIETWGSDERIIEAARMSTNKGFLGWGGERRCKFCHETEGLALKPCSEAGDGLHSIETTVGDEKLLRFLWENRHATPFEMAGMTIEVKAPILVFREWHRHRVPFGYNEMSARYTPLPDENYLPSLDRCRGDATTTNKQAQGVAALAPDTDILAWLAQLADVYDHAQRVYEAGLKLGIPKEIARCPVPVARYSRMRATGNLRGWLAFLSLRCAPGAQFEIRSYANVVSDLIRDAFPRTHALFAEKR